MFSLRRPLPTSSRSFSRLLCTSLSPSSDPLSRISNLPTSLRPAARRLLDAIAEVRNATARACADGSDDDERRDAVTKAKYALALYVDLVAKGDPPVRLSPYASHVLDDNDGDGDHRHHPNEGLGDITETKARKSIVGKILEPRNDVMRALGEEVHQMKDEAFLANRQRIWIGWHGWF